MEILYRNREEITRTFQKNRRRFPKRMKNLSLSRSISKSRIGGPPVPEPEESRPSPERGTKKTEIKYIVQKISINIKI